jgi:hypothetical protein
MSLNFIHNFQLEIHRVLSGNQDIRLSVDKIYLSMIQDGKYPFIFINILKIVDISKFDQPIYEVEFEISAFARDKNQGFLVNLADKITKVLNGNYGSFDGYIIAGIKSGEISFHPSQDLITTRLSLGYKALLKKDS